jgi:hypothetical protein
LTGLIKHENKTQVVYVAVTTIKMLKLAPTTVPRTSWFHIFTTITDIVKHQRNIYIFFNSAFTTSRG